MHTQAHRTADIIAAYEVVIKHLPDVARWRGALTRRTDGSSVEGVCAVWDDIRSELTDRLEFYRERQAAGI